MWEEANILNTIFNITAGPFSVLLFCMLHYQTVQYDILFLCTFSFQFKKYFMFGFKMKDIIVVRGVKCVVCASSIDSVKPINILTIEISFLLAPRII